MLFKTSDNVEINYEVTGKGKTIVLVNGFGAYQETWSAQVPFLNKLGYQVLTYDHRNMGKSQRTEKGHTIERLTQDLNELTSFLKIKQAIFMGHSMGASIIFCLMKNNPKLVKQALLIDQSPKMLNDENWKYGFMDYTKENYLKKCQERPRVHETYNGLDDNVYAKLMKAKKANPFNRKDNVDLLENHMSLDWRRVLEKTTIPTTFFVAEEVLFNQSQFDTFSVCNNKIYWKPSVFFCNGHQGQKQTGSSRISYKVWYDGSKPVFVVFHDIPVVFKFDSIIV